MGTTRWDVCDVHPPIPFSKQGTITIDRFDGYSLTLLWLSATVTEESIVTVRNIDPFVPEFLSGVLGGAHVMQTNGRYVLKTSSVTLARQLREIGFTGRKDASLPPPPVDDIPFLTAFFECRASFVWSLRYQTGKNPDKSYATYYPSLTFCASRPIMDRVVRTLCAHGMIPHRTLSPASNGTSSTLRITSNSQLRTIHDRLSPYGKNTEFWNAMYTHITTPPVPYYEYRERKDKERNT